MENQLNNIDQIYQKLVSVSSNKQKTFRVIQEAFVELREAVKDFADKLCDKVHEVDEFVDVEYEEISEFEFNLKFSGDTIVFMLQSNVVTLPDQHPVMQTDYVKEDSNRKYFGHIMMYNFLSDTIKFHRIADPGYLVARLLVNSERHFFIEGVRQMNFLFDDISSNVLSRQWLDLIVEKVVLTTIDIDLIAPNYADIRNVKYKEKVNNEQPMGRGEKIGFQIVNQSQEKAP